MHRLTGINLQTLIVVLLLSFAANTYPLYSQERLDEESIDYAEFEDEFDKNNTFAEQAPIVDNEYPLYEDDISNQDEPVQNSYDEYPDIYAETDTDMVDADTGMMDYDSGMDAVNSVESIGFEVLEGVGIVTIKTTAPIMYSELPYAEKKVRIKIEKVFLPEEFKVSRDVTDFDSPVSFISSFIDPANPEEVIVIVEFKEQVIYELFQDDSNLIVKIGEPPVAEEDVDEPKVAAEEEVLWAFDIRASAVEAKKVYKGQMVSFDFKKAKVTDVLRILAEISGFNFVLSKGVGGNVTLKLINVPWDLALDIVLEEAGLGAIVEGNIIKIMPLGLLQTRQNQLRKAQQSQEDAEPLITKQVFVNYATAADMNTLIKPQLSPRGKAIIDGRTNSLLITDTAPRIAKIEEVIKTMDTVTPQILIEARIVQATLDFTRELGVQWGANYRASAATGNPTGAFFPSNVSVGGVTAGNPGPFQSISDSFIIDLPAATGQGAGGALGIVLGSLTGAFDLDIRLSALESRGEGRILSSPKVLTLDNVSAKVEQGTSIPFLSVSSAGTQTQFVDATLKLQVTPQVTNDNRIKMKITVTDNAPDPAITGANGTPGIRRNEANTEVLARDGETIVIGGVFTRTTAESMLGVPWFSKLPLIGFLFNNTSRTDIRRELLVFVTPRIIRN